jgi:hypothetical protein
MIFPLITRIGADWMLQHPCPSEQSVVKIFRRRGVILSRPSGRGAARLRPYVQADPQTSAPMADVASLGTRATFPFRFRVFRGQKSECRVPRFEFRVADSEGCICADSRDSRLNPSAFPVGKPFRGLSRQATPPYIDFSA